MKNFLLKVLLKFISVYIYTYYKATYMSYESDIGVPMAGSVTPALNRAMARVIINLTLELNALSICSGRQLLNQIVLLLAPIRLYLPLLIFVYCLGYCRWPCASESQERCPRCYS